MAVGCCDDVGESFQAMCAGVVALILGLITVPPIRWTFLKLVLDPGRRRRLLAICCDASSASSPMWNASGLSALREDTALESVLGSQNPNLPMGILNP